MITNTLVITKTSFAWFFVTRGIGYIKKNDRELKEYFLSEIHQTLAKQALAALKLETSYDVTVNVEGGGITGQAEAVRLGIARALVEINPENKPTLRKEGFLTRDSRMVERKKPGRRKARRRFQFSKR